MSQLMRKQQDASEIVERVDGIISYVKNGVITGNDTDEQKKQALILLPLILTKDFVGLFLRELVQNFEIFISKEKLADDDSERYRIQKQYLEEICAEFDEAGCFNFQTDDKKVIIDNQKQALITVCEKAKVFLLNYGVRIFI